MTGPFRSFVLFAGMRTGSNLLEATLNANDIACFGEAYNPYFMGWPGQESLYGMTMADREADPLALWRHMAAARKVKGFRYFHDHDPRVFDPLMDDPTCAKIILTRNPVDSWVSTRLAQETDQWKLNESERPIDARTPYDPESFREALSQTEAFLNRILHGLQRRGQTGFWLNYDDLRDADVMTGLFHWLGRSDLTRVEPATDQVPQNPRVMADKVLGFDAMQTDLLALDPFRLHSLPSFEPRRGPAVPSYATGDIGAGLVFMPVRGAPDLTPWMRQSGAVNDSLTQNTLRQWKRAHPGHRSVTVLRHPLPRAWAAFQTLIGGNNTPLKTTLAQVHRVPVDPQQGWDDIAPDSRITLFAAFLDFLRRNLNGQTTLETHPGWATQTETVSGFARFGAPDMIVREDRLAGDLGFLLSTLGAEGIVPPEPEPLPPELDDPALRRAAKAAYLRDYVAFGFDDVP
ncbi:MAG: hypothetical protein DI498_05750 [Paracoccus denitrificans]|nr:MAG: hypothetical protein DI498_05750 [Paracoccus denitrificans]PZO84932.1 MAG: hypothetical protein DI633_05750 [Paracoccus denitrificans]